MVTAGLTAWAGVEAPSRVESSRNSETYDIDTTDAALLAGGRLQQGLERAMALKNSWE